ncbi:hypothetical protein RXV95_04350 [Novosphingobium sp. ZN18A2]
MTSAAIRAKGCAATPKSIGVPVPYGHAAIAHSGRRLAELFGD